MGRTTVITENCIPGGEQDEATNVRTRYGYNALGNRLWVEDARGYTTTYEYNPLYQVVTETDPLSHVWNYAYDSLGRHTVVTDPLTMTASVYDSLGRLQAVYHGGTVSATYAYDVLGNRTAMTDATGVTMYLYDDLGRILLVTHTVEATLDYTVGYSYDGRGLRTHLFYPDGTALTYTYDLVGRLTAVEGVTTSYAVYEYDEGNQLLTATLGNGVVGSYRYDAAGRLLDLAYAKDDSLLSRFAYTYDLVGNSTRAVETVRAEDAWGLLGEEPGQGPGLPIPPTPAEPFQLYLPLVPNDWPPVDVADWPRVEGVAAPLVQGPPDGSLVRDQSTYRVRFDRQGLRYEPKIHLVEQGDYHVDFHLVQVQSGKIRLFHPGAPQNPPAFPPENPNQVFYERGDSFREEYLVGPSGVEQRFVFLRPLVLDGDLEIEGILQGNLVATFYTTTGEIQFKSPAGDAIASYGRALLEDACGERKIAGLELNGQRLRLVVPREWLESACFPVVVDPLIGPNFAVSTQPLSSNQERAAVVYGGGGTQLVVWQGAGSSDDVFGQVVSSEGMLVSATIPLDTGWRNARYPDVAGSISDTEYLAAWQYDNGMLGPDWDIYAQRVDASGARLGGRITVYSGTDNQEYPAVALNPIGRQYLVVWRSYSAFAGYAIYGQFVHRDGTTPDPRVTVATSMNELSYPDVTFNPDSAEYLIVWQQNGGGGTGWNIRGQRLDDEGNLVSGAFGIAASSKDQTLPAATYSVSDTEYLVTWQRYVDGTSLNDVLGRRVSITGTLEGITLSMAIGSDDQRAPEVAYSEGRGEVLVSWERQPAAGMMGWDIYARRAHLTGVIDTEFAVSSESLDQRYPAVAYDAGTAQYVVSWQDYRGGSDWDVYVQRVGDDGSPRGEEVLASAQPESHSQQQAAAAYGSVQGLHLVVWTDGRNGTDDVYGQLVSGGGALVGSPLVIANSADYQERTPVVAYDATDDVFLVAWARYPKVGMILHWDIIAQRIDGSGDPVGSQVNVCTTSGDQTAPEVAYSEELGYFLVGWEDYRGGLDWDVYARAVQGSTGNPGSEFAIYYGAGNQRYPDVAANDVDGEYLLTWQDDRNGNDDIYGRRAGTTGASGSEFAITMASKNQQHPAVAFNAGAPEYLVTWQDDRGNVDWDIYAQRVATDTDLLGTVLAVYTGTVDQQAPAVASNGAEGWVVAWQDGAGSADVRVRILEGSGTALGTPETLSAATNSQEAPALSYDTERGRYLAVWADSRNAGSSPDVYGQLFGDYTVVVDYTYDPLGRLVRADYSTGVHFGYEYDRAGNRVTLTETSPVSGTIVTDATFDAVNRMTTRESSDGRSYSYDWSERNELLAERTLGQAVRTFAWDAAGQLVEATVFTLTTYFTYAGDGTRTAVEVVGQGTTTYVSDRGGQILVADTGVTTTWYLYGHGCPGEVRDGNLLYYLTDGRGYVRQLADADGAIVDAWLYTPDGGIMSGPAGPVSHLVCGGIYDWSTGLIYKGGRYFDPTMGIWLALSPLMVVGLGQRKIRGKKQQQSRWYFLLVLVVLAASGILIGCAPDTAAPTRVPNAVVKDLICTDADTTYETKGFLVYGFSDAQKGMLGATIEAYDSALGSGRLDSLMQKGNGGEPRPVIDGTKCWGGEQILGGRSDILLGPAVFDMELALDNNFSSYGAQSDSERAKIVFGHEIGHNLIGLDRAKWVESQDHGYKHVVSRDWSDSMAAEQEAVTNLALYVLDTGRLWNMPFSTEETDQTKLTSINTWVQDVISNVQ